MSDEEVRQAMRDYCKREYIGIPTLAKRMGTDRVRTLARFLSPPPGLKTNAEMIEYCRRFIEAQASR